MTSPSMDLDRLMKLRLVVARFGEMDLARWWSTKGQLGRLGAAAVRRGFPRTHRFAQARAVIAVAAHRCAEVFDPPGSVTLWRLPENIEEELDARCGPKAVEGGTKRGVHGKQNNRLHALDAGELTKALERW